WCRRLMPRDPFSSVPSVAMASDELSVSSLRLSDLLQVLRRRWLSVAGATCVITLLALTYSLTQPSVYKATARILLRTVSTDAQVIADPNAAVPFFADRQLKNAAQLLESTDTRAAVAAAYHGHAD